MTILAQLNDCHSCNDARSIVQKKRGNSSRSSNISPEATIPYLMNCLSLISWELVTAFPRLGAVAFTVVGGRTVYPSGVSHPSTSLHYTALLVGTTFEFRAYDARTWH